MHWKKAVIAGIAALMIPSAMVGYTMTMDCGRVKAAEMASDVQGSYGLLSWPQNLNAVRFEVEIFAGAPKGIQADRPVDGALYRNGYIYTNHVMLDMTKLPTDQPLFWRVKAYDLDGNPVTDYSQPAELLGSLTRTSRNAPIAHHSYNKGNGSVLLFPVYSYTGNPGAVKYEVEVMRQYPENLSGHAPSKYRVYANVTELTDLYDEMPRIGTFYWRVRGMDANGIPVGEWSIPQEIRTPAERWEVAIFGDSISHGGGHLSFSPADMAYSYASYLDFPSINLSESGNTSEMMTDRFERDVLPFHPKYLLIMGGTNSLRGGVPAASVISDLKEMQEKARENGIIPILLTLPPINPENIQKAFQEPTAEGWKEAFAEVNAFIRTQPHIDVAAPFDGMEELPTWLALDGLHGDWNMKQMMAQVINGAMGKLVSHSPWPMAEVGKGTG